VTSLIDYDYPVRTREGKNLEVPDVTVGGPRMEENDRDSLAVNVVEGLYSMVAPTVFILN
jgi:hypothetical protein